MLKCMLSSIPLKKLQQSSPKKTPPECLKKGKTHILMCLRSKSLHPATLYGTACLGKPHSTDIVNNAPAVYSAIANHENHTLTNL